MKRIVVLGGGTGGTLAANRLYRDFGVGAQITVVDRDDDHVYQPGLLFVPFGMADTGDLVRSRPRQLADGTGYHRGEVECVDVDADRVHLADGTVLRYDALVIATGARLVPERTEGLTGPGWRSHVDTFTTSTARSAWLRRWRCSTAAVWWSTSSGSRSSARSPRSSSASSPTGSSRHAASGTGSS